MSKSWIVGEVEVVDALTGNPLQVDVDIQYHVLPHLGQAVETTHSMQSTDANGKSKFEHRCGRRIAGPKLRIRNPWYYESPSTSSTYTTRDLSRTSCNDLKIELEPLYPFLLRVVNSNCFGPDDTLWINDGYVREAYGCADTTFGNSIFTRIHSVNEINFNITTKKNGILNSYSETFQLLPAQIKQITINY